MGSVPPNFRFHSVYNVSRSGSFHFWFSHRSTPYTLLSLVEGLGGWTSMFFFSRIFLLSELFLLAEPPANATGTRPLPTYSFPLQFSCESPHTIAKTAPSCCFREKQPPSPTLISRSVQHCFLLCSQCSSAPAVSPEKPLPLGVSEHWVRWCLRGPASPTLLMRTFSWCSLFLRLFRPRRSRGFVYLFRTLGRARVLRAGRFQHVVLSVLVSSRFRLIR